MERFGFTRFYHLQAMELLTYNQFCGIYSDKATEEGYSQYKIIFGKILELIPFMDGMRNVSGEAIEDTLSLREFCKLQKRGHLESVSQMLFRFSEMAVGDVNYSNLQVVERVFSSNERVYEEFLKKNSVINQYLETHPKKKQIRPEIYKEAKNKIIQIWFDSEKSLAVCKGKIKMNESNLFKKIDSFFDSVLL